MLTKSRQKKGGARILCCTGPKRNCGNPGRIHVGFEELVESCNVISNTHTMTGNGEGGVEEVGRHCSETLFVGDDFTG
jgi:hypothetical protein